MGKADCNRQGRLPVVRTHCIGQTKVLQRKNWNEHVRNVFDNTGKNRDRYFNLFIKEKTYRYFKFDLPKKHSFSTFSTTKIFQSLFHTNYSDDFHILRFISRFKYPSSEGIYSLVRGLVKIIFRTSIGEKLAWTVFLSTVDCNWVSGEAI